jgi:hypothetical protein
MRRGVPARQGERRATFVALHFGVFEIPVHDTKGHCGVLRRVFMLNRLFRMASLFAVVLLLTAPARAQSPSPDALAAAKELLAAQDMAEQFKSLMPMIMRNLKPAMVQGRADLERDYDTIVPILLEGFQARISELSEAIAIVYANNFSADELRAVTAFYKSPVGRNFLQKTSAITAQTLAATQKFAQSVAGDMQKRIIEELRKKGHTL